jgi:hypothetical protein
VTQWLLEKSGGVVQKNMGTADRLIRSLAAIGVGALYFTGTISGTLAAVLGIFAGIFLLTSLVSWCPMYAPLGVSTRK